MAALAKKKVAVTNLPPPEERVQTILAVVKRHRDQGRVFDRLDRDDRKHEAAFEKATKHEWDDLEDLRAKFEALPPHSRPMGVIEQLISAYSERASKLRRVAEIVTEFTNGVAASAASADFPEPLLRRALTYAARPAQRDAQHAINLYYAAQELASDLAPDNVVSGDPLTDASDIDEWFSKLAAE